MLKETKKQLDFWLLLEISSFNTSKTFLLTGYKFLEPDSGCSLKMVSMYTLQPDCLAHLYLISIYISLYLIRFSHCLKQVMWAPKTTQGFVSLFNQRMRTCDLITGDLILGTIGILGQKKSVLCRMYSDIWGLYLLLPSSMTAKNVSSVSRHQV